MLDRATLRVHALCLAAVGWSMLAWSQFTSGPFDRFGQLRGVDFAQFYAAAWLVVNGLGAQLYDWELFGKTLPLVVPGVGDLLFLSVYPPQVAAALAPFGSLGYRDALAIWTIVSLLTYAACTAVVLRALPALWPYRLEGWAFALGFPPLLQLVAHGQITAPALAILVAAFLAFRAGRPLALGLALGSLAFKPQLLTIAAIAVLLQPSIWCAAGIGAAIAIQLLLAAAVLGPGVLLGYAGVVETLLRHPQQFEPKIWAMHSLKGAIELVADSGPLSNACWMAAVVATLWLARRAYRRVPAAEPRFAVILLAGLLINPHLYVYDLVLLALGLALIAAWIVAEHPRHASGTARVAYALVWTPLAGAITALTYVQLTSPVMMTLMWTLGTSARASRAMARRSMP
jgi:arabinofuranan 3-O-arabinosyltransferase